MAASYTVQARILQASHIHRKRLDKLLFKSNFVSCRININMKTSSIPPVSEGLLNVIIETPRQSSAKYHYETEMDVFLLKKMLPLGMAFPFDFGFVPNTIAGDGDPVDVLVIMDQPALPGCLVRCRAIAVLEAEQAEKEKEKKRNDRVVAIPDCSAVYTAINELNDLSHTLREAITRFFKDYNERENKIFVPLAWRSGKAAMELVEKSSTYINR